MVSVKMIKDVINTLLYQKNDLIIGLTIATIAFLIYANSLSNGFVWDDDIVVVPE